MADNTITRYIVPALAGIMMLSGCTKQELETTFNSQEEKIDSFIETQLSAIEGSRVVRNGGSNRLVISEGEGPGLQSDGTVSFYYAGYVFTGSLNEKNPFATNREEIAAAAGWELTAANYNVLTVNLKDTELVEGLKKGLVGIRAGEECYIIFSGKYGFGKKVLGTIPANSALLYHIWAENVSGN